MRRILQTREGGSWESEAIQTSEGVTYAISEASQFMRNFSRSEKVQACHTPGTKR